MKNKSKKKNKKDDITKNIQVTNELLSYFASTAKPDSEHLVKHTAQSITTITKDGKEQTLHPDTARKELNRWFVLKPVLDNLEPVFHKNIVKNDAGEEIEVKHLYSVKKLEPKKPEWLFKKEIREFISGVNHQIAGVHSALSSIQTQNEQLLSQELMIRQLSDKLDVVMTSVKELTEKNKK